MNHRSQSRERETSLVPAADFSPFLKLLSDAEFALEIKKEISRSNRRQLAREFSLLQFPSVLQAPIDKSLTSLLERVWQRIRISDAMGWQNGKLAILLPETDRQGATELAKTLASRLSSLPADNPLAIEITVYPWDDELISSADELNTFPSPGIRDPQHEHERFEESVDSQMDNTNDRDSDYDDLAINSQNRTGQIATMERPKRDVAKRPDDVFAHTTFRRRLRRATDLIFKYDRQLTRFAPVRRTPVLKRTLDVVVAGLGLAVLSPFFAIAAIAIKTTSPGPIFFAQNREGKDGKVFKILKFRSMVVEAERMQADLRHKSEQDGPAFKLTEDPRVTLIGKYLRKSCVDELPQLVNVLIGNMSLVGPRPLPVGESFGCKAWHRARLTVLPGLTCTWQASGRRGDIKFDDWMRMDLNYIEQQSLWFDVKLLFRTAIIAVLHRGSV